MRKTRGRKPNPPGVQRSEVVRVRVTPDEAEALRDAAATSGYTVSEHLRTQGLRGSALLGFRVPEWERNMLRTAAELSGVSFEEYLRRHALINVKANNRDVWSPRGCDDAWHEYAYKTDAPTEGESRCPATCPSCGLAAPLLIDHGDGRYEVELPGFREGEGDAQRMISEVARAKACVEHGGWMPRTSADDA